MPRCPSRAALPADLAGLTFHDNGNGTATLSGIPEAGDSTDTITVSATNGSGNPVTQSFTLTILQPPTFLTAPLAQTITHGTATSYGITVTGSTPLRLSAAGGLPSGLTFKDNHDGTATILTTTALAANHTYTLVIAASNGTLPAALQLFTLVVQA